jgi:hypothetical protein
MQSKLETEANNYNLLVHTLSELMDQDSFSQFALELEETLFTLIYSSVLGQYKTNMEEKGLDFEQFKQQFKMLPKDSAESFVTELNNLIQSYGLTLNQDKLESDLEQGYYEINKLMYDEIQKNYPDQIEEVDKSIQNLKLLASLKQ